MSTYFAIQNKLSGNVIDIQRASTKAGVSLDAFPQKSSGNDNQLWEFVPDPANSGYWFIKSKLSGNVIDIQQASTKTGALLDAFPQKSSGTANQLWEFVADPAGSGCFFIVSQLNGNVIDIQGASTKAGVGLDAYPWKLTRYDNQLWTVVDGSFPSVVETVPVPPGGYSGLGELHPGKRIKLRDAHWRKSDNPLHRRPCMGITSRPPRIFDSVERGNKQQSNTGLAAICGPYG